MYAFIAEHLLITNIIIVLVSLALLGKASALTVTGVSSYARKLGLSDYLIGLFVVAVAASVPEFLASLSAISLEAPEVVLGTIFGSNFLGITLVLGILALVGKKVSVKEKVFQKTKWDILLLVALPFLLMVDGVLGFFDGVLLLVAFVGYLIVLWKREGQFGKLKKNVNIKTLYKDATIFLLSLVVVLLASLFMVRSSLAIAALLELPTFVVALVIIGIGSQVPDLFLSLQALKKGHEGVALGELIGSMIAKSLLFLGVFALLTRLTLSVSNVVFIGLITVATSWLLFQFVKKKYLLTWHGYVLLGLFVVFMAVQIMIF